MPAGQGVIYNTSGVVLSNSHIEFYTDEDEAVDIYRHKGSVIFKMHNFLMEVLSTESVLERCFAT